MEQNSIAASFQARCSFFIILFLFQLLTTVELNDQLFMESTRLSSQSGTAKNHGPGSTWTMDNQDGMRIPNQEPAEAHNLDVLYV